MVLPTRSAEPPERSRERERPCGGRRSGGTAPPCGRGPNVPPIARSGSAERDVPPLGDLRFRALLSDAAWRDLPPAIRARFSKRVAAGATVLYVGHVVEASASRAGRWLAQAARLVGGPLPTAFEVGAASAVAVTEDKASGGQVWTRLYARSNGFPQIVHSSKRFAGPTGLEEHVGCGLGMALRVGVENGALVFRSAGYFVHLFGRRLRLPTWLSPGALTVTHAEDGDDAFRFTLDLVHPQLGALVRQVVAFKEAKP